MILLYVYLLIGALYMMLTYLVIIQQRPELWHGTPIVARTLAMLWLVITWPFKLARDLDQMREEQRGPPKA